MSEARPERQKRVLRVTGFIMIITIFWIEVIEGDLNKNGETGVMHGTLR
jgi:hypothetical protein